MAGLSRPPGRAGRGVTGRRPGRWRVRRKARARAERPGAGASPLRTPGRGRIRRRTGRRARRRRPGNRASSRGVTRSWPGSRAAGRTTLSRRETASRRSGSIRRRPVAGPIQAPLVAALDLGRPGGLAGVRGPGSSLAPGLTWGPASVRPSRLSRLAVSAQVAGPDRPPDQARPWRLSRRPAPGGRCGLPRQPALDRTAGPAALPFRWTPVRGRQRPAISVIRLGSAQRGR